MESEKYLEGKSMQRPPLFESDGFIYWKNRFETYVKSKDLDLWHVITDGDFPPIQFNPETKKDEIVSFHKQDDDLKKKLAKNNEAKMVIYNALPRKEYERIFMCQTAKEIWDTLLITHQGLETSRYAVSSNVGYGVLGISWSKDQFDIFQNILLLYCEYGVLMSPRQHIEQSGSINDTYVVDTIDSNVIPNSLDMYNDEGEVDQDVEQDEDE
ncbi:hypothetical protein Tco_1073712, partial [Tanacetum coccineum]